MLYRAGFDANLTLGNKKAVDIVVVRSAGDAVTIDVKAIAGRDDWMMRATEERKKHFIVLVSFDGKMADLNFSPRVWVIPHGEALKLMEKNKAGLFIRRWKVIRGMGQYENAWHLIGGGEGGAAK